MTSASAGDPARLVLPFISSHLTVVPRGPRTRDSLDDVYRFAVVHIGEALRSESMSKPVKTGKLTRAIKKMTRRKRCTTSLTVCSVLREGSEVDTDVHSLCLGTV